MFQEDTTERCRQVIALWDFAHPDEQDLEVLEQVEVLILHAGNWYSEKQRRLSLEGHVEHCLTFVLRQFCYQTFTFGDRRSPILTAYSHSGELPQLPEWLRTLDVDLRTGKLLYRPGTVI